MNNFKVELQTVKGKEKEMKFLVVSIVINGVPVEISRAFYDDKMDSLFKLAESFTQVK